MSAQLRHTTRLLPSNLQDVRIDMKNNRMVVGAWIGADRHRRYLSYPLPADLADDLIARPKTKFPVHLDDFFTV